MSILPTAAQLQVLATGLASIAPPGWSQIRYTVQTVGPTSIPHTVAQTADGEVVVNEWLPIEADDVLHSLRREMYRPGAGTWFTATITVRTDARLATDFDYDNEPEYGFAPNSWVAESQKFPRTPQNTPAWLAAKVDQPDWVGARWQLEFTADGAVLDRAQPLDGTTTDQGHLWSAEIAQRLRSRGHDVAQRVDDGEDGQGNEVQFDELTVTLGTGYMSLAFFRHEVFWTTEAWPDEVDEAPFIALARDVLDVVRDVTGYDIGNQPDPYERKLLGLGR